MLEDKFQALRCTFIPEAVDWRKSAEGLDFLVSRDFGEWLNETAAAVNSATLDSLCYTGYKPTKALFAAGSTGKYKSKKVGFRLCYLGMDAAGQSPTTSSSTK